MNDIIKDSNIWQWAIACFVIAGLTGFLFRLGFVIPLPANLSLQNIRHAHSHLMFFSWASLLPLYLIKMSIIPGYHAAKSVRLMKASLWAVLLFGLFSFPSFLMWGYRPVAIGSALLPVSAIISGLVMIGWYGFMIGYLITRFRKKDFKPNSWFEGALVMLFVCSLGAWGVGSAELLHLGGAQFSKALTHFFLTVFVDGWVLLVLLGLIAYALKMKEDDFLVSPTVLIGLIAIGSPLTFSYGIPESMIDLNLSVAARLGGLLVAEGVIIFVISVFKKYSVKETKLWIWPILFLVLKAVMQFIASVTPAELWLSDHGVRILYLHVILLGAFTMGMSVLFTEKFQISRRYCYAILVSVSLVIFSLLFMTGFWPANLSGAWMFNVMIIFALLPVASMIVFWMKLRKQQGAGS